MPKASKSKALSKTKTKTKGKRKYIKKMLYKCVAKSESVKWINYQEKNEHGAYNNIVKAHTYYSLIFGVNIELNRVLNPDDPPPPILSANFSIETCNKEVYDKYSIGQEYKDLPLSG